MPVTLKVAEHESTTIKREKVTSTEALLEDTDPRSAKASKGIIQSSFSSQTFEAKHLISSTNGFVKAAFRAYSKHHHLTIRPDDVWFAILSQLSFYINANAEALRDHFVSHQGKEKLVIRGIGPIEQADFGVIARQMTALIQEKVKDPDLRDWMMPAFSTTTVNDRTVAAILMMGSMKAYFSFRAVTACGLPSVTLLGERADYEDILARLDKLPELGPETSQFADLLRPVLRGFIATFDPASEAASRHFWGLIVHKVDMGSGSPYLEGWLNAFCFWDEQGKCKYRRNYGLELDGVEYHCVDIDDIPAGCASVPFLIDDYGVQHHTKMIAGSLGIECTSSNGGELDSMQSLSGWVMFETDSDEAGEDDDSDANIYY